MSEKAKPAYLDRLKFVRSKFHARWSGVLIEQTNAFQIGRIYNKIFSVLVLLDRRGNPVPKRMMKTLSEYWLDEIAPIELTNVNRDWFPREMWPLLDKKEKK